MGVRWYSTRDGAFAVFGPDGEFERSVPMSGSVPDQDPEDRNDGGT